MVENAGLPADFPPVEWGGELLDYLWKIGPTKKNGPIEGRDLLDWAELWGIEWQPYEADLLFRLSRAYLGESHAATKRDAKCPWPAFESRWRWARNQIGEKSLDKEQKRAARRAAKLEK